jgi:hypothetical protein
MTTKADALEEDTRKLLIATMTRLGSMGVSNLSNDYRDHIMRQSMLKRHRKLSAIMSEGQPIIIEPKE